jgi:hypothetical protein
VDDVVREPVLEREVLDGNGYELLLRKEKMVVGVFIAG